MFRSFLRLAQSPRAVDRASLTTAALYAAQAVVCAIVVMLLYNRLHWGSPLWAVVSAVLVLQPGLKQSYGASATRFLSNLVGAVTGALVDHVHGHGPVDVLVALVLVVFFCELLRLDRGLRSACACVAIVMMTSYDAVVAYATERRVLAVMAGCITALIIQILTYRILKLDHGAGPANMADNE